MNNEKSSNCPCCKAISRHLIDWEFSGLGDSVFNYIAEFYECPSCGLVYIKNVTDGRLQLFYEQECSYSEKDHFSISSPKNIEKYEAYRKFIIDSNLSNQIIADIGCGRGGFVIHLNSNGWDANCVGVDIDLKSFPSTLEIKNDYGLTVSFCEGKAVALPFPNDSQSLLTYFHVLEHICSIDKVLQEAYRVLKYDGHILIEVPDAKRYKEYPIGSAFWFSIREHIYHFSGQSLAGVLNRNGFEVLKIERLLLPTPEFYYPSLMVLAKKRKINEKVSINGCEIDGIAQFVIESYQKLKMQADKILAISANYSVLTFWGFSSELFSLLPLLMNDLRDFNLCDSSKVKQKSDYKGIPVKDPKEVPKFGALIVVPYLHGDAIEKAAIEMGWKKEDIFRLE